MPWIKVIPESEALGGIKRSLPEDKGAAQRRKNHPAARVRCRRASGQPAYVAQP